MLYHLTAFLITVNLRIFQTLEKRNSNALKFFKEQMEIGLFEISSYSTHVGNVF